MSARLLIPAALLLCGVVSHPAAAAGTRPKLVSCTYQVADLVIPVNDAGQGRTTEEALIKRITSTIQPRSWSERGGVGTIDYYPMTMALVVSQTPDVQEQVADLLAALRRVQDVDVQTEVRLVTVPVAMFRRLTEESKLNSRLTILDDSHLAKLLEAIQADPSASVMQTPRLMTFSGHRAFFLAGGNQASRTNGAPEDGPKTEQVTNELRVSLLPTVSADRRTVAMTFEICKSELHATPGNPPGVQVPMPTINRLQTMLAIPDGHTAVMKGWTQQRHGVVMASSIEYGLPILSAIPYVNRLFRTVSYTPLSDQVLILVTPRIVVAQEKEERKASICPCPRATSAACATPATRRPCQAGCQTNTKQALLAALLRRWNELYSAGKYEEAQRFLEKAHELDPGTVPPATGNQMPRVPSCLLNGFQTPNELLQVGASSEAKSCGVAEQRRMDSRVAELLAKYHTACRAGRLAEATQLAVQALALDPTCFSKACGCAKQP